MFIALPFVVFCPTFTGMFFKPISVRRLCAGSVECAMCAGAANAGFSFVTNETFVIGSIVTIRFNHTHTYIGARNTLFFVYFLSRVIVDNFRLGCNSDEGRVVFRLLPRV